MGFDFGNLVPFNSNQNPIDIIKKDPTAILNPIKAGGENLSNGVAGDSVDSATVANTPPKPLSQDNPLPWQVYTPQPTLDLARSIQGRGTYGDSINRSELLNYGTSNPSGQLNPNVGTGLGSKSVNAMSSALQSKYNNQVGSNVKLLKDQQLLTENPELQKSNELARASEIYGKDQANKMANFKEQYNYEQERAKQAQDLLNAQNAATAGVMSSILGLGGSVAKVASA